VRGGGGTYSGGGGRISEVRERLSCPRLWGAEKKINFSELLKNETEQKNYRHQ